MNDMLPYTKGEKIAEGLVLAELISGIVAMIICMIVGLVEGFAVLFVVLSVVIYGIFTCCSVYPQWTNIVSKPERYTDEQFHKIRWGCIIAKIIFIALLVGCSFLPTSVL